MASSPAPETKREEALVALGRREAAQRQRAAEKVEENKELKKERNAYKAALRESEEERAKGSPMEKVIMGVSLGAGVAAGGAAQHYGLDKTALPSWAKKGLLPTAGGLGFVVGILVPGPLGNGIAALSLGLAAGSGAVSVTKKLTS